MKNMDRFLQMIAGNFVCEEDFDKKAPQPEKLLGKLKEIVSEEVFNELNVVLLDYTIELSEYAATEGMKLAIAIMDGDYSPKL